MSKFAEMIAVPHWKPRGCAYCSELIEPTDDTVSTNAGTVHFHRNCLLRQVIGSVAHLEKNCSCYIEGSILGDPEGMTPREAADAAVVLWKQERRCITNYRT